MLGDASSNLKILDSDSETGDGRLIKSLAVEKANLRVMVKKVES